MRRMTLLVVGACAMTLVAGCDAPEEDPRSTSTATQTSSEAPETTSVSAPPATSLTALPQIFDHAAVQDAVHQVLTGSYRLENVRVVMCPPDQPVEAGTVFHCTATIDGQRKKIRIKVTSDDGDYTVGRPE